VTLCVQLAGLFLGDSLCLVVKFILGDSVFSW